MQEATASNYNWNSNNQSLVNTPYAVRTSDWFNE
jgi:hypothetical protein